MKRLILASLVFFIFTTAYCQINLTDSSVQVISYWKIHDTKKYQITENSFQMEQLGDTTKFLKYNYTLNVEIVDTTAKSYTSKWAYTNLNIEKSWNPILEKLIALKNNLTLVVKTTEMGEFQELVNWEELSDSVLNRVALLKSTYKDQPEVMSVIEEFENKYISKESIVQLGFEEIPQFYTFHGQKFKLNEEYYDKEKCQSPYSPNLLDVDLVSYVSEINSSDDNSVLRASRIINTKQLTDATYDHLKKLAKNNGKTFSTNRIDFPLAINSNYISTRIEASTGWVLFSIQNREYSVDKVLHINDKTIVEQ